MRLPIDECVDERLRLSFPSHDCMTARFAGLAGLKNGQLPDAAEAAGFDVLITVDQNIPNQQNLGARTTLLFARAVSPKITDAAIGTKAGRKAGTGRA